MEKNVLDKIVDSKKLPVLFIGSGISKRYLFNYPTWDELLELSFKKYNSDIFQLQKHKDALFRQNLSDFEINAKLASIIENEFNAAFFDRKIKLNIGNAKNPEWVKRGISPYKMFLSSYFKKMHLRRGHLIEQELERFKQLKNKISAIITTNYDLFLETFIFPDDYTVFTNQTQLFNSDSYNIAEIYKIHGSATDANSIIITEQDYRTFNDSRKLIIAKMLTLFAESPIVFLGYSFTGENIQGIISDFLGCLSPIQLQSIHNHFIFISYKKGELNLQQIQRTITTRQGNEIPITEIQTDNYLKVYESLNKITPGISPVKIRATKRIVKNIVDNNLSSDNVEATIVGLDDLNNMNFSNKPLAIAIGYRESILNKFGYGIFDDTLIFEDILYDNKHFDADSMCSDRFKSIPHTRLLPVFKYVKATTLHIDPLSHLGAYIEKHNSIDLIITKKIQKSLKNVPTINNFNDLLAEIDNVTGLNKKAGLLLKNITSFNISKIREICKRLYSSDKEEIKTSTHFKRCVMYIDLMENYL